MTKSPSKKPTNEEYLSEKLADVLQHEQEEKAKQLAIKLNLPYVNITAIPVDSDALMILSEKETQDGKMAVIQKNEDNLKIIAQDPDLPATQALLKKLQANGTKCQVFVCSPRSLKKAQDRHKTIAVEKGSVSGQIIIEKDRLSALQEKLKSIEDVKKALENLPNDAATDFLENIIVGALQTDTSDIHLESRDENALFRYRIDGILHDVVFLSLKVYALVISRLKLMSGMVLNVHDRAQDGRFTIRLDDAEIEVRASIIPGPVGENVVMRILNPKNINLSIKDLGFREDAYQFIKKEIIRPNGMIVTTGPTGSGKTTALYAFLKEVTDPEIKIITLEDPVEYHLAGVTQTQVEADRGYTFAAGLRAILRQDPDVVLVGEIRDKETAEIAIQAALTGHIVFSTLHTNDAAGAIPRFIDMGSNPTSLSAAIIDIMAQRLLRRICSACKEEYEPTGEELDKIKKVFDKLPKTVTAPDISKPFKLARGKGCPKCNNTGYKGRVGVYEIVPVDSEIEKLITKSPSHAEILEVLKQKGFVSMYDDGIIKVVDKMTTIEEVEDIVGTR
jgi:type IV pilus assembly protein PilB